MENGNWDLIVIGGGPAGLTAGIYGARSGLKTLVLEKIMPGGTLTEASMIENYPGFPEGINGLDLAFNLLSHCENAGAKIQIQEEAIDLKVVGDKRWVTTDSQKYSASSVIIATGTNHRTLKIPTETKFRGRGISYCATCDGPLFKDKNLIVVGGGNSAAMDALFLSDLTSTVKLVHRRSMLRADNILVEEMGKKGIEILYNTEVKMFKGDEKLSSVLLLDKKKGIQTEVEVDGVFIEIGRIPNTDIAKRAGVSVDDSGYIIVDMKQKTNLKGVFAAGDATVKPYNQIGIAVGDGVVAALEAYSYIKRPYYHEG